MQPQVVARPRQRIFYGWWIVLGGLFGMAVSVGFANHGLTAFVIPLSDEFTVGFATMAALISVGRVETAFIGPLEGYLVDRFGPRTMIRKDFSSPKYGRRNDAITIYSKFNLNSKP